MLLYMFTASGHMYVQDERTRFDVTRAIIEHGTLAIERGDGDIARNGKLYSKYGLGQSLLAVPFYAVGRIVQKTLFPTEPYVAQLGVCFFNIVITAMTAALMYLFLMRLGHGPRAAFAAVLLYGTCTMAWPYTQTFFTEPLAALFLLGAAYFMVFGGESPDKGLATGAMLGGAFLTRADTAVAIAVFGLLMFIRWVRRPSARMTAVAAAAFAPIAAAVGLQLTYNWWRFGNVMNFGYHGESFTSPLSEGLSGLLISTGKGLFFFSPAVLLSVLGFAHLFRRNRAAAFLCVAPLTASLFEYGRWNLWGGDLSWGPRYLVTFLPLAIIPAVEYITRLNSGMTAVKKSLLAIVVAVALCVNVLGLSVNFHVYTDLLAKTSDRFEGSNGMMLAIYFNPRFSPIAGHAEILRIMATGDRTSRMFNPDGNPDIAAALTANKVPDFWWAFYLDKYQNNPKRLLFVLGTLALIATALAASVLWLMRDPALASGSSPIRNIPE